MLNEKLKTAILTEYSTSLQEATASSTHINDGNWLAQKVSEFGRFLDKLNLTTEEPKIETIPKTQRTRRHP